MNEWEERIRNSIRLNEIYGGTRRWIEVNSDDLKAMLDELSVHRALCGCRFCQDANTVIG